MTKSNLTDITILSPNGYFPRSDSIRKVTIHHMAGVMSAEQCGYTFQNPSRQASSNYGIGNDGRIGCYIEEENGSWCSSSYWNDNQSITIEVSNSYAGNPWPISGAAWNSLIALCADICTRYGIEPYYDGTTNASFTEHRMFAATACPGEFIHERMEQIVQEVRDKMQYSSGGWEHNGKGWWYLRPDDTWPANEWNFIDGEWYWFDSDGYMVTGWVHYDGKWYWCDDNGAMVSGWKKIKWHDREWWFWFANSGEMAQSEFCLINDKWYAFDEYGCMVEKAEQLTVDKKGAITIKSHI